MAKSSEKVCFDEDLTGAIVSTFVDFYYDIVKELGKDDRSVHEVFTIIREANNYKTMTEPTQVWLDRTFVNEGVRHSWSFRFYSDMGHAPEMHYPLPEFQEKRENVWSAVKKTAKWCYDPKTVFNLARLFLPEHSELQTKLYQSLGEPVGEDSSAIMNTMLEDYCLKKTGRLQEQTDSYNAIKAKIDILWGGLSPEEQDNANRVMEEMSLYRIKVSAAIKRVGNYLADAILQNEKSISEPGVFDPLMEACESTLKEEIAARERIKKLREEQEVQDKEFIKKCSDLWSRQDRAEWEGKISQQERDTLEYLKQHPELIETEEDKAAFEELGQRMMPFQISPSLWVLKGNFPYIYPGAFGLQRYYQQMLIRNQGLKALPGHDDIESGGQGEEVAGPLPVMRYPPVLAVSSSMSSPNVLAGKDQDVAVDMSHINDESLFVAQEERRKKEADKKKSIS